MALYHLKQNSNYSIDRLVTSVNSHFQRVSMHGLRIELLQRQAEALGLPLEVIELPEQPDMEDYNRIMSKTVSGLKNEGFTHSAFGDIFLEDLRRYREEQLNKYDIQAVFPLWKKDTTVLINDFIDLGFKAIVVTCDAELLGENFAGRLLDRDFINDLPEQVDPCGENGEFHTFCFDGPLFREPVKFEKGEKVYREYDHPSKSGDAKMGFWYCDLI